MKKKKIKGLSMQLIPLSEITEMSISDRVKRILSLVLGNKIVLIQGRLGAEEEARLIEDTMALVDHVKNFKGIELAVIEPDMSDKGVIFRFKQSLVRQLIGDNNALTVIGPASIIKDIKKDPKKIELMFK